MKRLNLNSNSINETALLAISSCIDSIEKLWIERIESIDRSPYSKIEITALNEIVKKIDQPVTKMIKKYKLIFRRNCGD